MHAIGFSVIYAQHRSDDFYVILLKDMLAAGCTAVELHTPQHDMPHNPELLHTISRFSYRAIHTSDLHTAAQDEEVVVHYRNLADRVEAAAITIHPHTMDHWAWLKGHFGDMASFENMDCFKPFGKTVQDMQRVMHEHPTARWTFDLNHVYSNDTSLAQVAAFYEQLGNPGHYHISGFKDASLPHTTLHTTHQDSIIDAVTTNAPIIIESLGVEDIHLFREEYDYVVERLKH